MKRYIVGKIVEKDGEKVLDGVTTSKGLGMITTGIFAVGVYTVVKKGTAIVKRIAEKINLKDKIEKVKTSINTH